MESTTIIKDNWILDREHSNKGRSLPGSKLLLDALASKIVERKNFFDKLKTELEESENEISFNIPDFLKIPTPYYKNYIFRSQNWIGYILKIYPDEFVAKLEDNNDPSTYEIARFEKFEVSKGDLDLLKVGAVFYWSVGYAVENGQVEKKSFLRFRRSADMSISEFDKIIDKAANLNDEIQWE